MTWRVHRGDILLPIALLLFLLAAAPIWLPRISPAPLVYRNLPFPVLNSPVEAGDSILMLVSRCTSEVDAEVYTTTRELVNLDTGLRTVLPPGNSRPRPGCEEFAARTAALPDDIEPGNYIYRGVVLVRGRWRTEDVAWSTQPFVIVAAETEKQGP